MVVLNPYAHASQYYDQYRPEYPQELITFIIDLTQNQQNYLDLGCGTGALLFKIAPSFQNATGVDIDDAMFEKAMVKKKTPQFSHVSLIRSSAEDYLAHANGHVDLFTIGRAIHWMDQSLVIERAYTLLEPGGILALVGDEVSLWQRKVPPFVKIYEIIRELEKEKGLRHIPAQGKDTSHQKTLDLIQQSPFQAYTQTSFSVGYKWDIEHILGYFYSASGFLKWLNHDRDRFDQQSREALLQLSPDGTFFDVIQFGMTYCRK